jgi:dCMP deaminase
MHSEANAVTKLAKTGGLGAEGATMYCTHSCCFDCAKLIVQAGIRRYVYANNYRKDRGIEFLRDAGVQVKKLSASG